MERVLVSWIGGHDIKSSQDESTVGGPIYNTLSEIGFDRVELLFNYSRTKVDPYLEWLSQKVPFPIQAHHIELTSPIHFGEIYQASNSFLDTLTETEENLDLHILLSPGTPAMQAVWLLLAKTRYTATFWQSSVERGVEEAEIPFEIAAEYVPVADKLTAEQISHLAADRAPIDAAFGDIVTQNPVMEELKARATLLARLEVPVLVEGESGTGKELFARAIHNASARAGSSFIAVNCGALPRELVDSMLFGHKKGAFTGADTDREGFFSEADGGTIFLDEFGELDPDVQVRLLRILEDGSYTRVGDTKENKADVRLIAATNRDLVQEVSEGRFREDLFFRVAVGVLSLPPLRERFGDLTLLTEHLVASITADEPTMSSKGLSPDALSLILRQPWRGNVRELRSVLLRAMLWSSNDTVLADDVKGALFKRATDEGEILGRDITKGIDLEALIADVYRHYIRRALEEADGNKTRATELLSLGSYQNLNTRMKNCGLKT